MGNTSCILADSMIELMEKFAKDYCQIDYQSKSKDISLMFHPFIIDGISIVARDENGKVFSMGSNGIEIAVGCCYYDFPKDKRFMMLIHMD